MSTSLVAPTMSVLSGTRADRARDWMLEHGMPTRHDEAWHYSPVAEIESTLSVAAPAPPRRLTAALVDEVAGRHGPTRLVFVNGFYEPGLSDIEPTDGMWCGPDQELPNTLESTLRECIDDEFIDGFQALNAAESDRSAIVIVDAGVRVAEPIQIVHITAPGATVEVSHPRTTVVVGAGAALHLVEVFASLPGSGFTNASSAIQLGASATLTQHRISNDAHDTIHIGHTTIEQAATSSVHATSVLLGARIARHGVHVALRGAGATSDIDGLYLPSDRQQHDVMVTVDHAASHCSSTQRFSGVIDDHARGSFSGHVVVRPDTVGTDAHQSNRNLLLCPTAEADARPWLEIFADDVRCTHGATIGRLDDEAFFYLRSRGIPADTARSMLVEAFVHEIIDPIAEPSLREFIGGLVAKHSTGLDR